jgi:hypothetical protein
MVGAMVVTAEEVVTAVMTVVAMAAATVVQLTVVAPPVAPIPRWRTAP